ncbi:RsfA family transcriptional regulator [Alicyclobacillaceae bacterium I2511]|nr:RsfA family transcriptional regulator [Alicyclobacillaceae bacterium I2511]
MQSAEKWVNRSDAWTPADDERLTSLVLQHIRRGSTQLRAFDAAAAELGRTAAACGYRWNGVLRKQKQTEIENAKQERKTFSRNRNPLGAGIQSSTAVGSSEPMQDVIHFLQVYDEHFQRLKEELTQIQLERNSLLEKIEQLNMQQSPTHHPIDAPLTPEQLVADSHTLFAIMERARRLLSGDIAKLETE